VTADLRVGGLDGRIALVTGGGGGIGRAAAEALRDQGARVAALDLRAPELEGALGVAADVTDEAAVDAAFARVEQELGPVAILVLCAGIFRVEPLEQTTLDSWSRSLGVNLTGSFLCARRALPGMRAAGWGRVICVGSSAGKNAGAGTMAAYAASKAGVMALAKSIAREYAAHGITANSVSPAQIDTPMMAELPDLRDRIPVGRWGRPEEVAELIVFLASEHAAFITGEEVDITGGFLID
jgi:NAD(P)-dependent dehydrogenase (short-subunit alcohol dehydrogenase family)